MAIDRRGFVAAGAAAAVLAAVPGRLRAAGAEMRLLTGWDDRSEVVTRVLDPLMRAIEGASGGQITLRRFGPETIPPFEQLDPTGRGVFDMLYTNGAYHYNQSAVAMAVEAFPVTPQTLRSSGMWDFVEAHYRRFGLKMVAYLVDANGYSLVLRAPLAGDGLSGLRIRGTPVYHPLIETLGAAPVVLPAAEIYPALERGVVDGAAWPLVGPLGFRWFEVAGWMMRPSFGRVGYPVFMNLARWETLDEPLRNAIDQACARYELEVGATFDAMVAAEEKGLAEQGMQKTELDPARVATLPEAWLRGVTELAAKQNPAEVAEMIAIARRAGLMA